jgi:hypothetical protein
LEYHLISAETYAERQWRYTECDNSDIYINDSGEILAGTVSDNEEVITRTRTEAEIQVCKENALLEITQDRLRDHQRNLIYASTWLIVFILLFGIHFPFFLKQQRKN